MASHVAHFFIFVSYKQSQPPPSPLEPHKKRTPPLIKDVTLFLHLQVLQAQWERRWGGWGGLFLSCSLSPRRAPTGSQQHASVSGLRLTPLLPLLPHVAVL